MAIADARTSSGSPNSNFGSSYLRIRTASLGTYHTYVRIRVAGVSGTVSSAILRLYAYAGGDSGGGVHTVSGGWSEGSITFGNAPPITGSPLDTYGAVGDNQWVEYDVTSAVTGNGIYSFGIKSTSSDSVYFYSREISGAQKPQLVITTTDGLGRAGGSPADLRRPTAGVPPASMRASMPRSDREP